MYYTSREAYELAFKLINDPIVAWRTCPISGTEFPITEADMKFYNTIAPTFDGEKFMPLLPTLCPEERSRRRIVRRNMRKFYKDTCDLTWKSMISVYNGSKPYKVYHQDVRRSDARDPMDYGRDYSFSHSFFDQFNEFLHAVPRMAMVNSNTINSEYCNFIKDAKNCYMSSVLYYGNENISYSTWVMRSNTCSDCYEIRQAELCYDCTSSTNIFHCIALHECYECQYCSFSANLNGCHDCMYCYNLSWKSYCIHNQQYTKEEYLTKIHEMQSSSSYRSDSQILFEEILATRPLRANWIVNSQNCIGSSIYNGKNAIFVFGGQSYEDVKYIMNSEWGSNNMDISGGGCERCFESTNVWLEGTTNILWSVSVIASHHCYYCDNCYYCAYCFGCIALRNKEYCIMNKQYTKEERFDEMRKIAHHMTETGEWGQFFPLEDNTFDYNETYAHDIFPLTREETLRRWLTRHEEEKKEYEWASITAHHISKYDPATVGDIIAQNNRKELLSWVIVCPKTKRWFRIVPTEIDLCVRLAIPIPTIHPDERFIQRYKRIGGKSMYLRNCDKTGAPILSVHSPDMPNPVYAEEVRDREVYG